MGKLSKSERGTSYEASWNLIVKYTSLAFQSTKSWDIYQVYIAIVCGSSS